MKKLAIVIALGLCGCTIYPMQPQAYYAPAPYYSVYTGPAISFSFGHGGHYHR